MAPPPDDLLLFKLTTRLIQRGIPAKRAVQLARNELANHGRLSGQRWHVEVQDEATNDG